MQNTFIEAGLSAQSKISKIADNEMVAFYPIFHKNASAALATAAAPAQ
jgi:hypothetical protein